MSYQLPKWIRLLLVAAVAAFSQEALAKPVEIIALGDSNTAGFLVGRRNAFPALIEQSLQAEGYDVRVSNFGISGDTTGGMLSRVDRAAPRGVKIAIVQGGYNDRRRGVPPAARDANIENILARLSARNVKVILCDFTGAKWAGIARRHQAVLVPSSTCYDAKSRGFDGLHMNKAGHRIIAARLTPVIQRLLGRQ